MKNKLRVAVDVVDEIDGDENLEKARRYLRRFMRSQRASGSTPEEQAQVLLGVIGTSMGGLYYNVVLELIKEVRTMASTDAITIR